MITKPPFVKTENFLDPLLTSDGQPYGQFRFNEIISEKYIISKHTHTSFSDVDSIPPAERTQLLSLIIADIEAENERAAKIAAQRGK